MTLYGWDGSHYDGAITLATAQQMKAEGITFASHKIGEGTGGDDPTDSTVLVALRDAKVEFLSGYHVVRSGPIGPQVDALIKLADRDEGWWRTFPGWFWQVDLERWPTDDVAPAVGIAFGRELARRTGKLVVLYASRGQYGDALTAWAGPLWNAAYGTTGARPGPFKDLYPGDGWRGWDAYSGQAPVFLQYTSSATIAGLTTCDANAYRGTEAQLRAMIHQSAHPMEEIMILARDGAGQHWLCDGMTSRPLTDTETADVQYLAATGCYQLATGTGPEWDHGVRLGWSAGPFGTPVPAGAPALVGEVAFTGTAQLVPPASFGSSTVE